LSLGGNIGTISKLYIITIVVTSLMKDPSKNEFVEFYSMNLMKKLFLF